MASPYDYIPDDLKRGAAAPAEGTSSAKPHAETVEVPPAEHKQRGPFKKRRAGVVLSREEVKAIRKGRRKLRREMRERGLRGKRDFELTAGSLGLYFDKPDRGILLWLWRHWLGALIGLLLALLGVLLLFSMVQRMRGHFTINLSEGMFREGFSLSETADFRNPTTQLFAVPAIDVPCISINQLPTNLNDIDGEHNDAYFAYTFYLRNEGDRAIDYVWSVDLNEETQAVSEAAWVLLFCDGELRVYAKADLRSGQEQALPPLGENDRGYISLPIKDLVPAGNQFRVVETVGQITYWRVVPEKFLSDSCVANGTVKGAEPMDAHKYTVVIWLEGDDPDATDDKIGGHLGVEMNFVLASEDDELGGGAGGESRNTFDSRWRSFWDGVWSGLDFL